MVFEATSFRPYHCSPYIGNCLYAPILHQATRTRQGERNRKTPTPSGERRGGLRNLPLRSGSSRDNGQRGAVDHEAHPSGSTDAHKVNQTVRRDS
jgi:hypothetical protein